MKLSFKKTTRNSLATAALAFSIVGCGTLGSQVGTLGNGGNVLGEILGAATDPTTITNVLSSVIGADKLSETALIGTWHYHGPGCAFTSDNLLAKAGGEVAATEIKGKLQTYYSSIGISTSNTFITFNEDKTFSGKIDGKNISGNYVYDSKTSELTLKTLLFSAKGYAKRNGMSGVSVLFESKKLLTLLQAVATMSGNSSLQTIGDLSKNYDGVRIGFDMSK